MANIASSTLQSGMYVQYYQVDNDVISYSNKG